MTTTASVRELTAAERDEAARLEQQLAGAWLSRQPRDPAAERRLAELDRIRYGAWHPSFAGSALCRSGSLASGGTRTYCACRACW